jgi:hypothetical protein
MAADRATISRVRTSTVLGVLGEKSIKLEDKIFGFSSPRKGGTKGEEK